MVEQQLRSLGLRILAPARPPTPEDVREPAGRPAPPRAGWEGRLVAQKRVGEPLWPVKNRPGIELARQRYAAGTHNMATVVTRDGWQQLYSWLKKDQW